MNAVAGGRSTFTLDGLSDAAFANAISPLFEGAPGFVTRLAAARPFGSAEAMFEAAESIALSMPESDQLELIDAHPRLGAKPGEVSTFSFREQGYDRESAPARAATANADVDSTPRDVAAEAPRDVAAELARLNAAYEARFGFRYCVFVAGRPRAALIPGFRAALEADPAGERARALRAVIAIARDRYRSTDGAA